MRQIRKYPLGLAFGARSVTVPGLEHLLQVALQNGQPTLWAMCDPSLPYQVRVDLYLAPTGGDCTTLLGDYAATVVGKELVHHVFVTGFTREAVEP